MMREDGTTSSRAPTLVLGIGNILLADDGVGVRAIEALRRTAVPAGVDVVDGGTAGADLLDILAERQKVIVVDAVDVGAQPGTVVRLSPEDLGSVGDRGISLHEVGLAQALAMVELLGIGPRKAIILGVQVESISCGLHLSRPVAEAMSKIVGQVLREVA